MSAETLTLWVGLFTYSAAALLAIIAQWRGRGHFRAISWMLAFALLTHGAAILLRWDRLDHGPYVDLFEALSSNVWSLHAALLLGVTALPRLLPILPATLPVLQVLVLWLMTVEPKDMPFPVTYDTVWLPVHLWVGKIFLGTVVLGVGASVVVLLRRVAGRGLFPRLPASEVLDEAIFRLVMLAFAFDCMMLVAGAAWAQDAWGRYWAWDPLETWSFLTWLAIALYLHVRVTFKPAPEWSAGMVVAIFVIAFGTFFGMPFVSTAVHQGVV